MFNFFSPQDFVALKPFFALCIGAMFTLLVSLTLKGERGQKLMLLVGLVSTLTSLYFFSELELPSLFFGLQMVGDKFSLGFGVALLILLFLSLPIVSLAKGMDSTHLGGVYGLLIFSGVGGLLMIMSNQLILFFVGLEILSLPLYVLTAFGRKEDHRSEAAFKYFILGALASALFVYGAALLWGGLGTLLITEMPLAIRALEGDGQGMVLMGGLLVFVAIGFKLGLVPFHMWLPDVYQGAPASVVAWMSGAVKIAAFPVLLRLFGQGLLETSSNWLLVFSWVACLSMLVGSLAALKQVELKRMLAYSSIAHAGYALIAVMCASTGDLQMSGGALVFYLVVYALASLASFVVVALEEQEGRSRVKDLAGLAKRRPALAFILAIALLSLAGIPPLGGFIGKFNLFALAVVQQFYAVVFIAVATSVISLAYYLGILVSAYMQESEAFKCTRMKFSVRLTLGIAALAIVFLGVLPGDILSFLMNVIP